jgi:acyl-CoA thioester hydrolase
MTERNILIIDDDETLVDALKEGLESLGYRVGAAYDGLQGILQAHQEKPDAIMLDFNMPAGGGAGVYERLRGSTDTGRIPIIFLTGATVEEVKGQIRSTPNTYFLKKPVGVAQLKKVLEKIMHGKIPKTAPKEAAPPAAAPPAPAVEAPPTPAVAAPPAPTADAPPAPTPQIGSPQTDAPFAGMSGAIAPPTPQAQAPAPETAPPINGVELDAPLPTGQAAAAFVAPAPKPAPAPSPAPKAAVDKPKQAGTVHRFDMRVTYGDTDRLGIVYYANYLKFFEQGRTELLRQLGLRYRDLEMERKIFLPAVESRCEYISPSRYDDLLEVRTWVSWLGPASICFQNEIADKDGNGKIVARGYTRHAVLNEFWKPMRIPADLQQMMAPHVKTA